jgi:hypothetical protein
MADDASRYRRKHNLFGPFISGKTKDKEKSGLSFINPGPFVNIHNKKCLVMVFERIENPVHTDSYPEDSFLANDFPGTAWMGFVGQFPDFPA